MPTSSPLNNNDEVASADDTAVRNSQTASALHSAAPSSSSSPSPNASPARTLLCANLCDVTTAPLQSGHDISRLCQLTSAQATSTASGCIAEGDVKRIYLGSYFCDRFFLSLHDEFFDAAEEFCRVCEIQATLVVPIFPQVTLAQGIVRIDELLDAHESLFDEITVNDYGMAAHMEKRCRTSHMALNWGRLFMKEQRDPRYAETANGMRPCLIDKPAIDEIRQEFPLGIVELDPFAPVVDTRAIADAAPIALHIPHCFMSTGHICEVASATRPQESSFRADAPCAQECCSSFAVSFSDSGSAASDSLPCYLVKSGRTVFFENPNCLIEGESAPARIIWSPETFAFTLPEETLQTYDGSWGNGSWGNGSWGDPQAFFTPPFSSGEDPWA